MNQTKIMSPGPNTLNHQLTCIWKANQHIHHPHNSDMHHSSNDDLTKSSPSHAPARKFQKTLQVPSEESHSPTK